MRGLIALTPIAITIAVVFWLFGILESTFSGPLKALVGEEYYFKGLGILVALLFIFAVGIVINNWLIKKIYHWGEQILIRIPLIKTVYTSIYDLLSFFNGEKGLSRGRSSRLSGLACASLVLSLERIFPICLRGLQLMMKLRFLFHLDIKLGALL